MAAKKSVYIGDRAEKVLGELPEDGRVSFSGRLNAVIDRYGEIIDRTRRELLAGLSDDEKAMIKMVQWSCASEGMAAGALIGGIAANLVDSQDFELMEFDREAVEALIAKAVAWTPAEELALVEWIEAQRGK